MESLSAQNVHDSSTAIVQRWLQDVEPSGIGMEEKCCLTQLSSQCISLFHIILKTLRATRNSGSEERELMEISLERSYGRMKIWSDENGVADGTLDEKLEASHDLQRDTTKYVVSIGQALTERLVDLLDVDLGESGYESISVLRSLTAAFMEGSSDTSSDSGFSDTSIGSVNDVLEDLRVDTTCLLDLEPLFCHPIFGVNPEPTAVLNTTRVTWTPHQPYSEQISTRFPMLSDELVSRLGKANYERYLRCQRQKFTNEFCETTSDRAVSNAVDGTSSNSHVSGTGSSLPAVTYAYPETVMSYGAGEGRRVRVPPLPARAKEGLPFACVACGKLVMIATNHAWKQHLYEDLQPWTCFERECVSDVATFATGGAWLFHLMLDHDSEEWRMIQCPFCQIEMGPDELPWITHPIIKHISDHLEEISFSALPPDCKFDDESGGSKLNGKGKDGEIAEKLCDLGWQSVFEERVTPQDESRRSLIERPHEPPKEVSNPKAKWSVAEIEKFPELLRNFGSDWQAIASHLGTKTATMVKDFYNKQAGHEKPEWFQIASEADQKLHGGEKLPVSPKPAGDYSLPMHSVEFDPQHDLITPPISAVPHGYDELEPSRPPSPPRIPSMYSPSSCDSS